MPSSYPESLDDLTNPESTSSLQGHADLHATVNDAIEAIELKLGVDGSSDVTIKFAVAPASGEYRVVVIG